MKVSIGHTPDEDRVEVDGEMKRFIDLTDEERATLDAQAANATEPLVKSLGDGVFELPIGGKPYKLRPTSFGHRTEKEALIIARRPSLADMLTAADAVPEKYRERSVDEAFTLFRERTGFVTFQEEAAFDKSAVGAAFAFWKAASEFHPEVNSLEVAGAVLDKITRGEAVALLALLGLA